MKDLRRMCAVAALTLVLAVAARAGDMSAGGAVPPSPPPTATTSESARRMAGAGGVAVDVIVALYQGLLSTL